MSILIKGMEMPTSCCGCVFSAYTPTGKIPYCKRTKKDLVADVYFNKRDYDCPLIEVPPHGRLIDADALKQHAVLYPWEIGHLPIIYLSYLTNAPTIIPAEEGEG